MWTRKSEKHDSGFPHLHFLWALSDSPEGAEDLGSMALREAGCSNTSELLDALAAWASDPIHQRRQAAWSEEKAAWKTGGRVGPRPRKPFHPRRLPFSQTRKRLERAAVRSGFGHLDMRPVDPSTFGTAHDPLLYFAKPFFKMAPSTNIPNTKQTIMKLHKKFNKAVQIKKTLPSKTQIIN